MSEPRRGPTALRLAAAAIFLLLVVGGLWLRAGGGGDGPPPVPAPAVPPPSAAAPAAPPPLLTRAELIDAAAAAADAYASGRTAAAGDDLAGRRFAMRIVFGCGGASPPSSAAPLRWEYDATTQTLKVTATPVAFTAAAWLTKIAGADSYEAAEGFWIDRPWQREAGCPAYRSPLDSSVLAVPQQTLAVTELFAADAPRSVRRDSRPYEAVRRTTPEEVAALKGFALVVDGRLTPLPGGGPIGCWNANPELRPLCVIGATFDRVSLENIASGETLAEWRR